MGAGFRQEVLNVILAQVLQERGVVSLPETIIKSVIEKPKQRRMPDLLVNFNGLRTMIEGEVGDTPGAKERALSAAGKRVEEGIAHIGIAVIYPSSLRQAKDLQMLKSKMTECQLEIAVVAESELGDKGYRAGDINYLAETLRKTFENLVKEDAVAQAAALLDAGIEQVAASVRHSPGFVTQAARILGIRAMPPRKKATKEEDIE